MPEFQFCRINSLDYKIIDEVINLAMSSTCEQSWGRGKALLATNNQAEEDGVMKQIERHAYIEDLSIDIVALGPALAICLRSIFGRCVRAVSTFEHSLPRGIRFGILQKRMS